MIGNALATHTLLWAIICAIAVYHIILTLAFHDGFGFYKEGDQISTLLGLPFDVVPEVVHLLKCH